MLRFGESWSHFAEADVTKKWTSAFLPAAPQIIVGGGRCGENAMELTGASQVYRGITKHASAGDQWGWMGVALNNRVNTVGVLFAGVTFSAFGLTTFAWKASLSNDGTISIVNQDGVVLATSDPDQAHTLVWDFIEFGWYCNGASSQIIVKVGEVEVINESGVAFGYTLARPSVWSGIALLASGSSTNRFGSLYVCDDYDDGLTPNTAGFLGDVRVQRTRPTLDGALTDMPVVGGGSQSNAVDKDDDSDLLTPSLQTGTPGDQVSNIYGAPTFTTGTIFGVQVTGLCEKDTSGPRTWKALIRSIAGAVNLGAAQSIPQGSKRFLSEMFDRDPATGLGWTFTNASGSQYGGEVD